MLGYDRSRLTERQRRNREWMTAHPGLTSLGAAVILGCLGLGIGSPSDEAPWLTPLLGATLGAAAGACVGWGLSQEPKDLSGTRRVAFYGACAVTVLLAIGGTVLNVLQKW